ncbi:MAG: hypothetical protein ACLUNO_07430 [Oscillospiraceae bacterium]
MKRILLCLLCAALLTGCGKETDPAVAAAQRYQPIVQAVGDGTAVGVDLTDAQIAQAVAELDAARTDGRARGRSRPGHTSGDRDRLLGRTRGRGDG